MKIFCLDGFLYLGETKRNGSICFSRDALNGHIHGTRRSIDGKYYLFAVQIVKKDLNQDLIYLSNEEIHLTLPTYLIIYQKRSKISCVDERHLLKLNQK